MIRKTVGFNLVSTGVVKLGISLSLGDVSFTEAEGGMVLSFVPTFDILGQVVSWNLDQVRICLILIQFIDIKQLDKKHNDITVYLL